MYKHKLRLRSNIIIVVLGQHRTSETSVSTQHQSIDLNFQKVLLFKKIDNNFTQNSFKYHKVLTKAHFFYLKMIKNSKIILLLCIHTNMYVIRI